MGSVARGVSAPVLVLLMLALGSVPANAADYDFSVSPDPPNAGQPATFAVIPDPPAEVTVEWDLDGGGDFEESGATVTHTFARPGPVTVRMRVTDADNKKSTVTRTVAVNAAPAVDFGFTPPNPLTGEDVLFTPVVSDPEGDDVTLTWAFGDGTFDSGSSPTHRYGAAGTYGVLLTAIDEHGAVATAQHDVPVREDPGPTPSYGYSPSNPQTGDAVTFTSTSTPSHGSITATDWDFDGDGQYDDASGAQATWAFGTAGTHAVAIRVTQANGKQAIAFGDVQVAERPAGSSPASPGPGGVTPVQKRNRPVRMRPFPIVRIAGIVLERGALVQILSVRAPRGSIVRVRCRGKGCPTGSLAHTSSTRLVRFHAFERRLQAGVTLEVFVRKAGKIGKYTRFLIRAGKAPARVDRCLMPGRERPVPCP
jgi:PKD repeat protein